MTALSRRVFSLSLAAAPAAFAAPSLVGTAAAAPNPQTPAPTATVEIGRFSVTALTDGYTDLPYGFFTGRPAEDVQASAEALHAVHGNGVRLSFNQYLVRDGDRTILIDTGPAGGIGKTGRLPGALETAGVKPEDVDAVILTHLHFDHISGAIAGGRKVFPNADIYVDRRDVAYFNDPAKRAAAPDFLHSSFDASAELLRLYPGVNSIDGEREVTSGVSILDLTGHTPGHVGVRVADGDKSLIMTSDMLFHLAVHPSAADIGFVFEQDPDAARRMRERFFPLAAEEGALIAATHMPFPGLGHIVRDDGKLRWIAADWAHGQ